MVEGLLDKFKFMYLGKSLEIVPEEHEIDPIGCDEEKYDSDVDF